MAWKPRVSKGNAKQIADDANRVRNRVFIRGKLIILQASLPVSVPPAPGMRKKIREFSRGARFRLLKLIAAIDWSKLQEGRFITLTWPDSVAKVDVKTATMQRHLFVRELEKYLGKQMPIIWRKEQQIRKSGEHTGKLVQHLHLCVFTGNWLDKRIIRQWWRKILHVEGPLSTDVKAMNSGEHAAFYIAKYLTVNKANSTLDYRAYLSKPGRAWGIHRKHLLPMHETIYFPDVSEEDYAALCEYAASFWPERPSYLQTSFTLVGGRAEKAKKEILDFLS